MHMKQTTIAVITVLVTCYYYYYYYYYYTTTTTTTITIIVTAQCYGNEVLPIEILSVHLSICADRISPS